MPHGQRAWSNVGADEVVHGLADMAELAARLGSPVTYNREGNVLFLSDFSEGDSQFELKPVGTGAEIIISAAESIVGPYAAKVTTSAVTDQVSTIAASVPVPDVATRVGLSAAVLWLLNEIGWQLEIGAYIGSQVYIGTLRYRSDLDRLDVRTTAWQTLASGLVLYANTASWHRAKVVLDLARGTYVRAMVDDQEYAVMAPLLVLPTAEPRRIDVRLQAYTRDGVSRVVYFDDIIVTHGEPA